MRQKDEQKRQAIIQATIKLVNEVGFVYASVSKIAREAQVSPATIYIYYRNKEDLLVSTYLDIKREMGGSLLRSFNPELPIRDILRTVWNNAFDFTKENPEYFRFAEQFSNSAYSGLVDPNESEKYFKPIIEVLRMGIEQKIIKDVSLEILTVFIFYPVMLLSNPRICATFRADSEDINNGFNMAWDAVRL